MTDRRFLDTLAAAGRDWRYVSLSRAYPDLTLDRVPRSLKVLLENLARRSPELVRTIRMREDGALSGGEIPFYPNRVLMHDTTCVPALADFAALRDAVAERGGDPGSINPVIPVHLVIDHSIIVEHYGRPDAMARNLEIDFHRNAERYRFVRWAERSLANFRVVPPGTGILHQINLELLADVVTVDTGTGPEPFVWPDTLVGTDSHTPMVNALGVLGWGVGGVEGQAAMLGEPIALALPDVVGVHLTGAPQPGVNATDLVLHLTALLRVHGVIGRFVEFYGPGVSRLSLADRATIANMAPEYGATCAYFPVDAETLAYLRLSGRSEDRVALVEAYAKAQGLWLDDAQADAVYTSVLAVDLGALAPVVAGPRHPHDCKALADVPADFVRALPSLTDAGTTAPRRIKLARADYELTDGMVALAAITSCTNTSNPALVIGAGLIARNARRRGLARKPWVKTSLSPGSAVVAAYLSASGLQADLDALGFNIVGFGCMTCIGNSGTLEPAVVEAVEQHGLGVVGVLSGNRNFDGRVNPHLAGAYLASPALVVAYALAGTITHDFLSEPLGVDAEGRPVMLSELWPSDAEISTVVQDSIDPAMFRTQYEAVWRGPVQWQDIIALSGARFTWDPASDYIRRPPYFDGIDLNTPVNLVIDGARTLLMLGDNVTTDHLSPAGAIPTGSLAGCHLAAHGVPPADFNQYSTRRGNHEVMLRGAFSNPRLHNELVADVAGRAGCLAFNADRSAVQPVYDAACSHLACGIPLVIVAGKNYGAGSSRDWAAKVTALLGVRVVIAESYERIHRSNLLALGVAPLLFPTGMTRADLGWDGTETLAFEGLDRLEVGCNEVQVRVQCGASLPQTVLLMCRIESRQELEYLRHGGILRYIARRALRSNGVPEYQPM